MSADANEPERRKPAVTTARGKEPFKSLAEIAAGIDAFCARMNTGLGAVAVVLAVVVVFTLSVKAGEFSSYAAMIPAEDVAASD